MFFYKPFYHLNLLVLYIKMKNYENSALWSILLFLVH